MSEPAGPTAQGRYRYYVVLVLTLVYLISSMDRTLMSALAEPIKTEFGLSDSKLGLLTGMAFAISYSLAGIPLGFLADRMRRTWLISGLVLLWSGLTAFSGTSRTWLALAAARTGVGAAESGASPSSMSLITDYFPKKRRGLALSLFYLSTPIGVSLGFMIGGFAAYLHGWRNAFFIAGIPGVILCLLILLTVREPARGQYDDDMPPRTIKLGAPLKDAFATLFAIKPLLYLMLAGIFVVIAQAGLTAFSAPFLIRVHGVAPRDAGLALSSANIIGGVVGTLAGGLLADLMARRSTHSGPFAVGLLMLFTGPLAASAFLVADWHDAARLMIAYLFFNCTYYGVTFATYMTLAPVNMRGVLGGMLAVVMTLVGYGIGPTFTGVMSDVVKTMGVADPLRWAMVATSGFYGLAAIMFLLAAASIRKRGKVSAALAGTPGQ